MTGMWLVDLVLAGVLFWFTVGALVFARMVFFD